MALKTDYKDDIFPGARSYQMVKNDDGTYSFVDVTAYTQEGDLFGANDINETNKSITNLQDYVTAVTQISFKYDGWSSTAPYTQTVSSSGVNIKAAFRPSVFYAPNINEDEDTAKDRKKNYGYITYFDVADGSVTATCLYKKPAKGVTVVFKGV